MTNAILVLTARGPEKILSEGGSQAWKLDADRAGKSEFLVCVQNRHNGDWGDATEPHSTAFLIGRITEIVPSPERPKRWLIKIGEYAKITVPNIWKGWRYPVRYMSLEGLQIDPTTLEFKPMREPAIEEAPARKLGDVIEGAIQEVAAAAGVPNSAVRISVDLAGGRTATEKNV
jgi:hypothetical protein